MHFSYRNQSLCEHVVSTFLRQAGRVRLSLGCLQLDADESELQCYRPVCKLAPTASPNNPAVIIAMRSPYVFRCAFDRSFFQS